VAIASEHGLQVIEDASEALGSKLGGRPLGSFGHAATFSFAPTKIITTGQGGVVVTQDETTARRIRELKDQGRAERGTGGADAHPVFGFNFKLSNVHAAIGLAQLERLPDRLTHMRDLHDWYAEELADVPGITLLPVDRDSGEALSWIDALVDRRDELVTFLRERRIDSREFWFPLHTQGPYASNEEFPNTTWISAHGLWLPCALSLTRESVAQVGRTVREFAATPALA
jgi:perosamine synthetase